MLLLTACSTVVPPVSITPGSTQDIDTGQTLAVSAANASGPLAVLWSIPQNSGALSNTAAASSDTYLAPALPIRGVVITAADPASPDQKATLTVNVNAPPALAASGPLPAGAKGFAYTTSLGVSGGSGVVTVRLTSGALPPGLALSTAGVLSGTPTTGGTYTFSADVTDSAPTPITQRASFSIAIGALTIDGRSQPGGIVGKAYATQPISPQGAIGGVSFKPGSNALPPGLSVDPATGIVSGTPSAAGSSVYTVIATDSLGQTATAAYTVLIAAPLSLPNAVLPVTNNGETIAPYKLQPAGGVPPYTFSVVGQLPAGVSLDASGTLSGSPPVGQYNFGVKVTDSGSLQPAQTTPLNQSAVAQITLTVANFRFVTDTLPTGVVGTPYSTTLQTTGGNGPINFQASGTLPAGFTLDPSGVLSGTAPLAENITLTVTAKDGNGFSISRTFPFVQTVGPLVITPATLPDAVAGSVYQQQIGATGGIPPYQFTLTAGTPQTDYTTMTYRSFGDSITAGSLSSQPSLDYVSLVAKALGSALSNLGVGGDQSTDMSTHVFDNENPAANQGRFYSIQIGTNDIGHRGGGLGDHEVDFHGALEASITWLGTLASDRVDAGSVNAPNWTDDTTFAAVKGKRSSVQGATIQYTLPTHGLPLYLWSGTNDGNAGAFTISVDGGAPLTVSCGPLTNIGPTYNGGTSSVVLTRIPVASGLHTVTITVTSPTISSNFVRIVSVGTPSQRTLQRIPTVAVGGVIQTAGDTNPQFAAQFTADIQQDVALLQGDTLDVRYVDNRAAMMGGLPSLYGDSVHPNDAGHAALSVPYIKTFQLPSDFVLSSSGALTGWPRQAGAYSVTVSVQDSEGRTAQTTYDITAQRP